MNIYRADDCKTCVHYDCRYFNYGYEGIRRDVLIRVLRARSPVPVAVEGDLLVLDDSVRSV